MTVFDALKTAANVADAKPDLDKLKKATDALEADMFKRFLKAATPKGIAGKEAGAEIYGDMAQDAVAEAAAKRGTLGVSRAIFERMAPAVVAQHAVAHRVTAQRAPSNSPSLAEPRKKTDSAS